MRWSPEEDISLSSGLRPTFEHYEQQESYGLAIFKARIMIEDVCDNQSDIPSLTADAKAELELTSYRRKVGFPNTNTGSTKLHKHQEDTVEFEIRNIIRTTGLECEPSLEYRPNSKTTFKSAIPTDKFPVAGVKNLHLSSDDFKFPNPYVKNKVKPKSTEISVSVNNAISSSGGRRAHSKSYAVINVTVKKYVTPAQLYALKAGHNRWTSPRHKGIH